ncbi:unnamed protein product [Mytilus coruscus]|uniref:Uncharacterized protein n=1 Tax=Mytilus coruscus TaxID=42192 RepID=A0A6J8AFT8_MYTCO|nr:unnamed protein product [Mytilus coruscus]
MLEECGISVVRDSQDKCKGDKSGKRLLELCTSLELFFANGRVGSDRGIGHSTCNNSVIDNAIVSPTLFRAVTDFFFFLPFDPILSDVHNPICLQLCSNVASVNNLNVSVDFDITNDSDIVIACEGESIVKPRWASDRAPVFTEKLDENSIDELLNGLEDFDPQNSNIVNINRAVDNCNNIIKNAAQQAEVFVKINNSNAQKKFKRQN